MTRRAYGRPRIVESRRLTDAQLSDLEASAIDFTTAGLGGVSSASHAEVYDLGIRGDGDLGGLLFRYWEPVERRFSRRFVRVKPSVRWPSASTSSRSARCRGSTSLRERPRRSWPTSRCRFCSWKARRRSLALDRALRQLSAFQVSS